MKERGDQVDERGNDDDQVKPVPAWREVRVYMVQLVWENALSNYSDYKFKCEEYSEYLVHKLQVLVQGAFWIIQRAVQHENDAVKND